MTTAVRITARRRLHGRLFGIVQTAVAAVVADEPEPAPEQPTEELLALPA